MLKVPPIKDPKADMPSAGPALPFLCHLVAVKAGHHRCCLTWDVDQDRCRGTAIHRAVIDPCKHDNGGDRRKPEGRWKEDSHGAYRPDARQHPHQSSDEDTGETVEKIRKLKNDLKARNYS